MARRSRTPQPHRLAIAVISEYKSSHPILLPPYALQDHGEHLDHSPRAPLICFPFATTSFTDVFYL